MSDFAVGDVVRVQMPRGVNKQGIAGISVMYTTWPEARFDGAVGDIVDINPRGPNGIPLYLVNFTGHDNRVAIPWQQQWFREEWIAPAEAPKPQPTATAGAMAAPEGQKQTTVGPST
ncbi:MAG TPA: hypothetical protein VFQ80_03210 [Thermomicrobiales bacterium]|nr:hypothetical protein [Thermomicrobiales bacterium]